MIRLQIALIVGGGFLAYYGFTQYRVSSGTTAEPLEVAIADLEADKTPDNNHVKIGPHVALYGACVYTAEQDRGDAGEVSDSAKVTETLYPLFSAEQFARLEEAEDPQEFLNTAKFAVLVKTKEWKTYGAIPDGAEEVGSVQGLFINRIESLDDEYVKLIKDNFPGVDSDKILILEKGRKPTSHALSLLMMVGGVALVGGGVLWMIIGFRS